MKKSALLIATACIAVTAVSAPMAAPLSPFKGPAVHQSGGLKVLYNQNSGGNGVYVNSQNYTSGIQNDLDGMAADDFIVPSGQKWKVNEVDVTGCCSGTPITENVFFFKDNNGVPGKTLRKGKFYNVNGTGNPSFQISLGKGLILRPGHYWVAVQANCDAETCGEWEWGMTSTITNDPAAFIFTGSSTYCINWTQIENCFGTAYNGDLLFELKGKIK